jgi:hypothetical protein
MATLQNAAGSNTADVNASSELAVALSKVPGNAGYANLLGENHDGAAGLPALRRAIYVSPEKRLGIGQDSLLWDDTFHHSVFNLRKYFNIASATALSVGGGFLTFNATALTTANSGQICRTHRTFPVLGNFPVTMDFWFSLALVPQAQNIIEIGLGIPGAAVATSPSDGIYMLIDTAGALQLVSNYNGTLTTSGAITLPAAVAWTAGRVYHAEIVVHGDRVELYFDGIYIGQVLRSSAASVGGMSQNQSGFLFARWFNAAATVGAQKLNIARWAVTLGDGSFSRSWPATRAGLGDHLATSPDGVAVAQLDTIVNSTAPVSATLSNTAAGYALPGGNFQFAAVAGAETDYALFAYQVPTASVSQPGRNMVITGIEIDSFNMGAAVATTPTLLTWYLGIGATAVSLATADAATTTTTRAPHKKFLGSQSFPIGALIGARADRSVSVDFSQGPLVVEPGTFLHIIVRMPVGTATVSQVIRGGVAVKGYFE